MRGPIKRQTLAVLRERQLPVATVLDIGVLSGTPELIEAYPDRLHVLFEPVKEFAETIERTYQQIPHRLVTAAVSDQSGVVALRTASIMDGHAISHSWMTDNQDEGRLVRMISLDDYLALNPAEPPYFLKIDIDGDEMKVLAGAAEALKNTSVVMIEVTVGSLIERVGFLERAGFRLFDLAEPCYYDGCLWQCDAVMVRAELLDARFAYIGENFDQSRYQAFSL